MGIEHLLTTYGYAAVFVLVGAETLGVPLPGETILIAAGVYAGSTHKLSVWLIFLVAAAAGITGNNIGFWIGNKSGYALLRRYGRYVHLDEGRIKVGRYLFDRHGGKVVFFGRFVSVLRTYAAILAGTNRMRWRRFLLYNALGGLLWAAIYSFVPFWIGHAVDHVTTPVDIGVAVTAVVVVVTGVLVTRRQAGRLQSRAEAAYPGPLVDR